MRRWVACTLLVVLFAGCSADPEGSPASSTPTPSAASTAASDADINASYDVGGYELSLTCQGTGPTVVYLHGLGGSGSDVNEAIASRLAGRVRLCTYDRVNVGQSDTQPERHSGADSVRDLHTLLTAAEVEGPYLLLGFSFGGLLAAMYAGTYPDDVMGILMLDASLPTDDEIDALIPADMRAAAKAEQEANQERVDFYRTLKQAKALLDTVPDVPLTYLAAEPVELPSEWPVERMRKLIRAKQTEFVDRFRQGRLVPVTSSHNIDLDQPDRVIAELDRILAGR